MRVDVPKQGFQTEIRGKTFQEMAKDILEISRAGLNARAKMNSHGENETVFLQELDRMAMTGQSNADRLIDLFNGSWDGDITRTYKECIF